MKLYRKMTMIIASAAAVVAAGLHYDAACGYSLQSAYQYFSGDSLLDNAPWISFKGINNVCASSRLSIDIWKENFRVGVYGGFLRRYELFRQEKSAASVEKVKVGEVLSIPVIGFVEGHYRGLFYEFGLGPYITRFNYVRIDLPEFSVMSIFGYLFGAGYEKSFGRGLAVQLKGELLVNAPIDVVEFLDPVLKNETAGSRFTEYNRNDYPTIMYNATISCGLQYDFGKKIRLPLEEAVTAVANSGFGARVRRLFGR